MSSSLRTGEPMHTVLPQTLLDRMLLHHHLGVVGAPEVDGYRVIGPDGTQSLDHMFYTSAVISVYQLMQVRIRSLVPTRNGIDCMRLGCSAWTNYMLSHADYAGRCRSAASRSGTSCTSLGGELIEAPCRDRILCSHDRTLLWSENRSLRTKRLRAKRLRM